MFLDISPQGGSTYSRNPAESSVTSTRNISDAYKVTWTNGRGSRHGYFVFRLSRPRLRLKLKDGGRSEHFPQAHSKSEFPGITAWLQQQHLYHRPSSPFIINLKLPFSTQ